MWVVGLEKSLEYLSILLGGVQGSVDTYDMLRFFFMYINCAIGSKYENHIFVADMFASLWLHM